MRKRRGAEVIRISGARTGLAEDVRGRQRRYVISMLVRTLAVILTVILWNVERHVAIVTLALGVLLPYVAVVIANAGRGSAPSMPSTYFQAPVRPMITPPSAPTSAPAAGGSESGARTADYEHPARPGGLS